MGALPPGGWSPVEDHQATARPEMSGQPAVSRARPNCVSSLLESGIYSVLEDGGSPARPEGMYSDANR